MKAPTDGVLRKVSDIALLLVGIGGIIHQEWTGQVHPELLMVYTAILGIPGVAGAIQLLRSGNGSGEKGGTNGSSSPSPDPESPSVSPRQ